jgi:hypothetical protein
MILYLVVENKTNFDPTINLFSKYNLANDFIATKLDKTWTKLIKIEKRFIDRGYTDVWVSSNDSKIFIRKLSVDDQILPW